MSLKYEKLIRKMTLAEKAVMMSGKNTWETVDFEKYGIPSMAMSDGPHGLRRQAGAGDHLGLNASLPATCFPTAAGVANSWDEALGEEIGEALAEEAVTMGGGTHPSGPILAICHNFRSHAKGHPAPLRSFQIIA